MKLILLLVVLFGLVFFVESKLSIEQLLGRKENLNGVEHVNFENSCKKEVKNDINVAISSLHSFEYGLAMKEWRNVIQKDVKKKKII